MMTPERSHCSHHAAAMSPHSDLVHAARREGAGLDEKELRAFSHFFDSSRLIEEVLAKHLEERHGMTIREYEILVRLDGAGGEMRLAELADLWVFSRPELTNTLVGLEDRGWIQREKAVGDGRGVVTHLLAAGADALATAAPAHAELIRDRLLRCWPQEDLDTIIRSMEASARRLRELRP